MSERPPVGIIDGRWYCDTCKRMSNARVTDEAAQLLLDAHLVDESHVWRVSGA